MLFTELYQQTLLTFKKLNIDNPLLESHILFEEILNLKPTQYFAFSNKIIEDSYIQKIDNWIEQKKKNVPTAYLSNKQEFYYNEFYVDNRVLIPRPETEELVEWVILNHKNQKHDIIIDLCTGSGCILISLAQNLQANQLIGIDISNDALNVAQINIEKILNDYNSAIITTEQSNLFNNIKTTIKADLIITNPPYVLKTEKDLLSPNVLDYEPHIALFLPNHLFLNELVEQCAKHLTHNGWLYIENHPDLIPIIYQIMSKNNFYSIEIKKDISNKIRFIKGQYQATTLLDT